MLERRSVGRRIGVGDQLNRGQKRVKRGSKRGRFGVGFFGARMAEAPAGPGVERPRGGECFLWSIRRAARSVGRARRLVLALGREEALAGGGGVVGGVGQLVDAPELPLAHAAEQDRDGEE